jgi:hypothetical protein
LTIDAGTGLGGNPKELELVSLLVNNRDKKIDIMYSEYTLIDGEKVGERIFGYSLVDGIEQLTRANTKIQAKNPDGTLAFETVQEQERNEAGEPLFNEDQTPKMISVQKPKYLTEQFTRWVTAFKPYLWDAAGVIKDGIKEYHGLI